MAEWIDPTAEVWARPPQPAMRKAEAPPGRVVDLLEGIHARAERIEAARRSAASGRKPRAV